MLLLVAATEEEMRPVRRLYAKQAGIALLVTGVGPVETTLALTRYLSQETTAVSRVISFGIAGAYLGAGVGMLDLCLARKEIFGDFGIDSSGAIVDFDWLNFLPTKEFELDGNFLNRGKELLNERGFLPVVGNFVTVFSVSGTSLRGSWLRERYDAMCENMEGAAVARVCRSFAIPCLELRTISNLVEDRDTSKWQTAAAINRCAEAVVVLVAGLAGEK